MWFVMELSELLRSFVGLVGETSGGAACRDWCGARHAAAQAGLNPSAPEDVPGGNHHFAGDLSLGRLALPCRFWVSV